MLTKGQCALLALIRSALWTCEPPVNADDAQDEARTQALVPLLFPDSPEAAQYAAHAIRILYAQDELVSLFSDAGIPMVILKGSAAAVYYPDPLRRTMGDIDLLVPPESFDTALALLTREAYRGEKAEDGCRHTALQRDGVTVELHRRFSSEGIDVERYVQRGLSRPAEAELAGHRFSMLPPLENGLVLLAHVAQHLRNELGLRQMIDWMLYVHAQLTDEYWETSFRPAAADCGLETLAITAARLCRKYLGLPDPITWCDGADEKLVDDLLDNLLVTGNFGHIHGVGSDVETVATNIKRAGLFRYLQQQGERNWKAYQKNHALKPLCWAYQAGRYLHRGLRTGQNSAQMIGDLNRSRARYELLTKLGLD